MVVLYVMLIVLIILVALYFIIGYVFYSYAMKPKRENLDSREERKS